MTVRGAVPTEGPPTARPGAGEQREFRRRAHQLCVRAEPHTEQAPSEAHLHEAARQLFGIAV